jgi:hypothetical protein
MMPWPFGPIDGSGQSGYPCERMHAASFSNWTNCLCSTAWDGGRMPSTCRQAFIADWNCSVCGLTPVTW